MKKILFVQRLDAVNKHGGDHSLLLYYKGLLEKRLGFNCEVYTNQSILDSYDCLFFFNIDRPMYYYDLIEICINKKTPYVIYTLHHPEEGILNYLKNGTFGIRKFISFLSNYDPVRYEKYLSVLKSLKNLTLKSNYDIRKVQEKIILNAKFVFTSSKLEALEIEKDICTGNFVTLPHYYETKECFLEKEKNLIVCAGRIESRKNQIVVLKIAKLNPDKKFVFVGNYNDTDKKYVNLFKKIASNINNVEVVSGLNKNEYYQYLCRADIFISLSYFEVVSLVELDAFAAGCKMIIGKYSYITEFIDGDDIQYLDFHEFRNLDFYVKKLQDINIKRDYRNLNLLSEEVIREILENVFIGEVV
ncbi:glycosyltransferase [Sulfuricurvum sp.]|uniref:glycosyltransferase n=1 Tax=Sulfuricurvum sp. TaxID=2025608 RepID=UPI003BB52B24